jgi:hypothetical protein
MRMVERALAVIGDRDQIASAELRYHLFPDWRRQYGDSMEGRQQVGLEMARALGVSPHQVQTSEGYRSVYFRRDLEARASQERPPRAGAPFRARCTDCNLPHHGGPTPCKFCGSDAIANRNAG